MEKANSTQFQYFLSMISYSGLLVNILDIEIINTGRVKAKDHQNLFNKSLYFFSSAEASGSTGTKSIPQMGQSPGLSSMISGCIGQVYLLPCGWRLISSTKSIPQTGQSPGLS